MGTEGGFAVNYDSLDQMGDDLLALADEFDGMKDQMSQYSHAVGEPAPQPGQAPWGRGSWGGGPNVANELVRVAKNWSDDRERIVEKMETAADYANQAAAVYRDLDTGLAAEFSGAGAGAGSGGGAGGGGGGSY